MEVTLGGLTANEAIGRQRRAFPKEEMEADQSCASTGRLP